MFPAYIITAAAAAAIAFFSQSRRLTLWACSAFFAVQAALAVLIIFGGALGTTVFEFFTFDHTAALFFCLLAVVSPVAFYHGIHYLDVETLRHKGLYNCLLVLLCVFIALVYFSNNIAVTWIFLEATTLCTAGLIYHRRSAKSLEATWKYIFVCSVGIAIAYLGILLLAGAAADGSLAYRDLPASVATGKPLFMKIAFLFVLVGYSCKMEIFPLYNIGIDANFAAPAPASALISTALVNAGFIAIFRIYTVMEQTEIFPWIQNVLILAGVFSVLIGAVFLRRTSHYKRLLSYSTVENMGITAICLGIGGLGVLAALLHLTGHTLIKSSMFLQIARVGKTYGHYRVNRTGDYININRTAAVILLVTTLLLLGFPPSPLFVSEIMMFEQMVLSGQWWLLVLTVLMFCTVIYNLGRHIIRLCYHPLTGTAPRAARRSDIMFGIVLLVAVAIIIGLWRPEWLYGWYANMIG